MVPLTKLNLWLLHVKENKTKKRILTHFPVHFQWAKKSINLINNKVLLTENLIPLYRTGFKLILPFFSSSANESNPVPDDPDDLDYPDHLLQN